MKFCSLIFKSTIRRPKGWFEPRFHPLLAVWLRQVTSSLGSHCICCRMRVISHPLNMADVRIERNNKLLKPLRSGKIRKTTWQHYYSITNQWFQLECIKEKCSKQCLNWKQNENWSYSMLHNTVQFFMLKESVTNSVRRSPNTEESAAGLWQATSRL